MGHQHVGHVEERLTPEERGADVVRRHEAGLTFRQIGQALGISASRATQMYHEQHRRQLRTLQPVVTLATLMMQMRKEEPILPDDLRLLAIESAVEHAAVYRSLAAHQRT